MRRSTTLAAIALSGALALVATPAAQAHPKEHPVNPGANITYGTWEHPFSPESLVNSVPVDLKLGTTAIPDTASKSWAWINQDAYGMTVARATASDPAVTIYPMEGEVGIWATDAEQALPTLTLPHFPAGVLPPSGTDGAVSVFDQTTGRTYNFWQLRDVNGTWHAKQVSWSNIHDTGFGDPQHYFRGARSTGADNLIGLIRPEEANDGAPIYYHALASTMDFSGLAPGHQVDDTNWTGAYTYPATQGDSWGPKNTGPFPEGTRLFLPKDFPVDSLKSVQLRKIARTLQVYGTYVVDRNWGTPITFDVANYPGFHFELGDTPYDNPNLDDAGDWDAYVASGVPQQLDDIRKALRAMVSNDGFLAADGKIVRPRPGEHTNLLSLRGPWQTSDAGTVGTFNSFTQRVEFTDPHVTQVASRDWERVDWARLQAGEKVTLRVKATGGATMRLQVACDGTTVYDSGTLKNGHHKTFRWPCTPSSATWTLDSGSGHGNWLTADLERKG